MLTLLEVIILGIVEGITEWLPISSTGHMLLVYKIFNIDEQDPFWSMFLVVIQFGAILAVILIYFWRLWPFHRVQAEEKGLYKIIDRDKLIMWLKIVVSCVPAAVVGLTIDDWIEAHLYNYIVVSIMLVVYGVLFIFVENRNKMRKPRTRKIADISWGLAFMIGIFQMLAIIPGTSRSGATILGGILLGMSRKTASEYTFFLAVPTMLGASVLKIAKFGGNFTLDQGLYLILGMAVAFLVSVFAIRFLMKYIRSHDFKAFGWYRIVLGVIVLLAFAVSAAIG